MQLYVYLTLHHFSYFFYFLSHLLFFQILFLAQYLEKDYLRLPFLKLSADIEVCRSKIKY